MRVVEGPAHNFAAHNLLDGLVEHRERMVCRNDGRGQQQCDHDGWNHSDDLFHGLLLTLTVRKRGIEDRIARLSR